MMDFPRFKYMAWAKAAEKKSGLHLCFSGMPHLAATDLMLDEKPPRLKPSEPYGVGALKDAIARRYGASRGEVFLSTGTSSANYLAMAVLLDRGDEVVVEEPAYEALVHLPRLFGARVRRWKRKFETGWGLDFDSLEKLLRPRTRLVVLTNPHNPSGTALSPVDLRRLAALAREKGFLALVDEVYIDMAAGPRGGSAFSGKGGVIATNSLTKSFGLGGIRLGWALAPARIVKALDEFQDLVSVINPEPSMDIALRAFGRIGKLASSARASLDGKLEIVEDFMRSGRSLEWVRPDASFCFPRLEKGLDCRGLVRMLEERFGTFVVPGSMFDGLERHFRLGFGIPEKELRRGLANISSALAAIRP